MADSKTDENGPIAATNSPFTLFQDWFEKAAKKEPTLPEAASLATVNPDGMPNLRMVLVKDMTPDGFIFYTNLESQKGLELAANPKAALCFHWKSLKYQIRLRGPVELVSDQEADAYFTSRPKDSQIGAWASRQSRPLEGRFELEAQVAKYAAKYAIKKVDRPPFWSGFRLRPNSMEFWRDQRFRLHDRVVYEREDITTDAWTWKRLFP